MASKNEKVFINKRIPLIKDSNENKNMLFMALLKKQMEEEDLTLNVVDSRIRLLEIRKNSVEKINAIIKLILIQLYWQEKRMAMTTGKKKKK